MLNASDITPSVNSRSLMVLHTELKPLWADLIKHPLLFPHEIKKASEMKSHTSRAQYLGGRILLRSYFVETLNIEFLRLDLTISPHGKPEWKDLGIKNLFSFNLSHSGNQILLAVHEGTAVGIDIESNHRNITLELARRFFSPPELTALNALPAENQKKYFLKLWTRKEAFVKADGRGVSMGLDRFDVSLCPELPVQILDPALSASSSPLWKIQDLDWGDEYSVALAAQDWDGTYLVNHFSLR